MTGFLTATTLCLFLIVLVLVVVLLITMNRTNERRMLAARNGGRVRPPVRRDETTDCCLQGPPCSARCAELRQTMMIASAVEAMRHGEGFQHVMRLAEQAEGGVWPPAMPGDAGHPAA